MGIGIDTAFIILKNKIPNALNSTVTEKHILFLQGQALEKLAEIFFYKTFAFPFWNHGACFTTTFKLYMQGNTALKSTNKGAGMLF